MSTKLQKRRTKQIRVAIAMHRELKLLAAQTEKTISRLADEILENALNNKTQGTPYPIS